MDDESVKAVLVIQYSNGQVGVIELEADGITDKREKPVYEYGYLTNPPMLERISFEFPKTKSWIRYTTPDAGWEVWEAARRLATIPREA